MRNVASLLLRHGEAIFFACDPLTVPNCKVIVRAICRKCSYSLCTTIDGMCTVSNRRMQILSAALDPATANKTGNR
jgi:acetyl-CoA carboxylase carboxyltransferase component